MSRKIYMDHAATTRIADPVWDCMQPYLKEDYGNPSSIYDLGAENKRVLLQARKQIAAVLDCEPQNIYFTSGGTESDNWALIGAAESREQYGRHIITSKIEHHAILNTCRYLEKRGFEVTYLDVDEQGFISPQKLKQALRNDTILVSIMTANNEIGTIQNIEKMGEIVAEHPALFHTDSVQAFGHIPVMPKKWKVDLLSASGHKFYGPKGIGFLYMKDGLFLPPFLHGGKQERGLRGGTENVAAIAGMGKAAELAAQTMEKRHERECHLRDYMIARLEQEIPYCRLNGSRKKRLANNVNVSFSYVDGETVVIMLDMEGICASSGSACSAGQSAASHVLQEIGLPDEFARGTIRLTLGAENTKEEIDYTVEKLKSIIEKNRSMNPHYQSFIKLNRMR